MEDAGQHFLRAARVVSHRTFLKCSYLQELLVVRSVNHERTTIL
jgi:hypothetical protein